MSKKSQYMIFTKYMREWLSQVIGFSKGYLSRINTGQQPLTRSFVERCCFRPGEPEAELFSKD